MKEDDLQKTVKEVAEGLKDFNLEKKWGLVCYLPVFNVVFCLIAFIRMPKNDFVNFHARQGVVLFALWFLTVFTGFISNVLSLMLWGITLMLYFVGLVIVLRHKVVKIPVVGDIAMKIPRDYFFKKLTGSEVEGSSDSKS